MSTKTTIANADVIKAAKKELAKAETKVREAKANLAQIEKETKGGK